jgi:glycosyltransferase involved in cell wall biosynthesis
MRVGVNTLFLIPGEVGGSETYLMETLGAIVRGHPDVQLVLFTNRENHASLAESFREFAQVSLHPVGVAARNRYARIVREQTAMPAAVRAGGVDVLWSPGYTSVLRSPAPQVVSVLDMQYKSHPEDLSKIALWTTDFLIVAGVRRCGRVIAISEFSKAEIVRHTGIPAEKIDVTPLAADPAFGQPVGEAALHDARSRLLGFEEPYLFCVAHSYPHKNLPALVEGFARMPHRASHRLVIVGKARRGEAPLQSAMDRCGVRDRVTRLAEVSRHDLIALYQGAALFVFPSLYEGFGLPVLEAMTAGVTVLAARRGALSEVGGEAVGDFDPRDPGDLAARAAELLSCGEDARSRRTAAARERAAGFSWRRTADATLRSLASAV